MGEVLDDVEEELGFFKLVVHLLDGLAADQVLGDLGPGLGAARRGRRAADRDAAVRYLFDIDLAVTADAAVLVDDMHAQPPLAVHRRPQVRDARRGRRHGRVPLVALGDELGAADAAVLLPRHLGRGAAGAVHAHALGSRRHVDDGPVFGDAIPGLAHLAAGIDLVGDFIGLIVVVDGRGCRRVGAAAPGDAPPALNVHVQVFAVRVHDYIVLPGLDWAP
jgi:hypothetical protein